MGLNRRTFLRKAGLGLAVLGVSETVLSLLVDQSLAVPLFDRYFQALAQPGGRKLALLVGINQYPQSTALGGCVTDVELQRELLIHRFGFNPRDILTLTDSQATRESIETGFVEHLTKQANTGDVVVFHFSGYGSRIQLGEESSTNPSLHLQNSFVPVDGILHPKESRLANTLLEETLALLLLSLATDRVMTLLDTSHTDPVNVLQGNLRVRSSPHPPAVESNPDELAFQDQILQRINPTRSQLKQTEGRHLMPGLVLAAAGPSQLATEAQWHGFSAGLFTYALTQYLWHAVPATTVHISLSRTALTVNQLAGNNQKPTLISQKNQNPLLAYYLSPDPTIGADGVVTAVEENGKIAQVWLAGLPATVLDYYGTHSLLELVSETRPVVSQTTNNQQPTTNNQPKLQLRSKDGLTAKARIVSSAIAQTSPLQIGQLVQESVRVLPRNLGLTVALDTHLERIERVDATSAFASIPYVSSVVIAGEQPADYLFGRGQQEPTPESTEPHFTGGYGLFYLARDPIRNTLGEQGEAVKSAVNRLQPKFKTLLAAKLLRLSANEGSSRLGIRAFLEMVSPESKVIMQRETWRMSSATQLLTDSKNSRDLTSRLGSPTVPVLPIGSRIQYRLENSTNNPIYFMILGFETSGNAIALYQNQSLQTASEADKNPPLNNGVIAPGETLTVPDPSASFKWIVPSPGGLAEIQLICSCCPFTQGMAALSEAMRSKGEGTRIADLSNPLDVAHAILQDLHQASAIPPEAINMISDVYALDMKAWATLSFIYQVV
ncbi:MAG TPA: peptidase C14 [Cyanobacteria bacterium UBA11162]|nr:peptidase C14 [Cyanobacteria bacterium UBA11162]